MSVIQDVEVTGPVPSEQELNRIRFTRALNRRKFMSGMGMAGAATVGASVMAACGSSHKSANVGAAGPSETDVLNFALNLEYLEASFYLYATTGSGLASTDTGGSGMVTGGSKVTFTDSRIADIAAEIAADEKAHVELLRTALGTNAVSMPNIDLAALGIGFATQAQFLTLARAFEDVGVSAYSGAATLLTGNNLQAAANILAVEAFHSGNIRLNIIQQGITVTAVDTLDVLPTEQAFFFDKNALAVNRTPSQVLAIVYANQAAGTAMGGFFPNGLNGNIKTV